MTTARTNTQRRTGDPSARRASATTYAVASGRGGILPGYRRGEVCFLLRRCGLARFPTASLEVRPSVELVAAAHDEVGQQPEDRNQQTGDDDQDCVGREPDRVH